MQGTDSPGLSILVADADDISRVSISQELREAGYQVEEVHTWDRVQQILACNFFDLVILDSQIAHCGLDAISHLQKSFPGCPIFFMSNSNDIDYAVQCVKRGADDFLQKPVDSGVLIRKMRREFARGPRVLDVEEHHSPAHRVPTVIGHDRGLRQVMELAKRVARADTTVLLRGETGVGKEVVANALHAMSERRLRPFVVANCAAVPRDLMESEMFGHVRGAFTGAITDHAGYFESASDGSLLLDEIGDLWIELQAKLLRVLEDKTFRRVGDKNPRRCLARLIASTNQPLEELVEEGKFRRDLYYRVSVFPISIPPLRERPEDIQPLAEYYMQKYARRCRIPSPELTASAWQTIRDHPWIGNVRELKNLVERLVLTYHGSRVSREQLFRMLSEQPSVKVLEGDLHGIEKQCIESTLRQYGGNRRAAARALGIARGTLYAKMKKYEIETPPARQGEIRGE